MQLESNIKLQELYLYTKNSFFENEEECLNKKGEVQSINESGTMIVYKNKNSNSNDLFDEACFCNQKLQESTDFVCLSRR